MDKDLDVKLESPLVALASREDINPEKLEKLLDLQERYELKQQEREFLTAMAKFQGECPTIVRRKKVDFKSKTGSSTKYDYAPLDEIVETIRPFLSKNGLSYYFDTKLEGNFITIETTVCHSGGFKKSFNYQSDSLHDDARMNSSQRRKSALTYAKRAGLENAFGLVTAGEDDDARRAIDKPINEDQLKEIVKLVRLTSTDEQKFLSYLKVDDIEELSFKGAEKAINTLKQKRDK